MSLLSSPRGSDSQKQNSWWWGILSLLQPHTMSSHFHGLTPRRTPGWHHWLDHWWNLNAQEVTRKLSSEPLFNRLLSLSTYSGFNFNGHLYKQKPDAVRETFYLQSTQISESDVVPSTLWHTVLRPVRWWLFLQEKKRKVWWSAGTTKQFPSQYCFHC